MSLKDFTREEFLQSIIQGTIASLGILPFFAGSSSEKDSTIAISNLSELPDEAVILFQGDSITDSGRNREEGSPNTSSGLGTGYAFLAATHLLANYPQKNFSCYNRGIGGDKVYQLAERWEADCLNLKPDILSILVGVNDFWHTLDFNYKGTAATYEEDFRQLLQRTQKELPDTKLIIGEPFALKGGSAVNEAWYPNFPKYQDAAKSLAKDLDAAFIPYQSIFDAATTEEVPATYWSADGVHPTIAGSQLMAQAWLETLKRI